MDVWLAGVAFADASHGWAAGLDGTVVATSDGGAHWSVQDSGTTAHLWAVACSDASHAWAVGQGGVIVVTTDGGAHRELQGLGNGTCSPL